MIITYFVESALAVAICNATFLFAVYKSGSTSLPKNTSSRKAETTLISPIFPPPWLNRERETLVTHYLDERMQTKIKWSRKWEENKFN